MALPVIPLPKAEIEVGAGIKIAFHSLTRKEALKVTQEFKGRADDAEVFILSCGLDLPEAEVSNWRETTDPVAVGKIVDEIIFLSGLGTRPKPKADEKTDEKAEGESPNS